MNNPTVLLSVVTNSLRVNTRPPMLVVMSARPASPPFLPPLLGSTRSFDPLGTCYESASGAKDPIKEVIFRRSYHV